MENVRELFSSALELFNDHMNSCGRFGVTVVDLLTAVLRMDFVPSPFFDNLSVLRIVFVLIYARPEHTILHLSLPDFLSVVFTKTISDEFLEEVENVSLELFSEENKALRFVPYKVVKRLIKAPNMNSQLCNVVNNEKSCYLTKGINHSQCQYLFIF
jgi:hypothetical protein